MAKQPPMSGEARARREQEEKLQQVKNFLNNPKNWTFDMIQNYMANSGLWLEYAGGEIIGGPRAGERSEGANNPNTHYRLRGMDDMPSMLAGDLPLSEWQQRIYSDYTSAIREAEHQAELGNPQAVTDFLLSTGDPSILRMMGRDPEASEQEAEAAIGADMTGAFPSGLYYDDQLGLDGGWVYNNRSVEAQANAVGASDWIKDLWESLKPYDVPTAEQQANLPTTIMNMMGPEPEPTAGAGGTGFAIIDGSQIPGGKPGERWFIAADGSAYRVDEAPEAEGPDIEGEIGRLILEGSPESIARARELWTLRNDIMNAPMSREDAQMRASELASNPDEYMAWMNALYNMPGSQMQDFVDGEVVTTPLGLGVDETGSQEGDLKDASYKGGVGADGQPLPTPSLTSEDFTADEELGAYPVGVAGVPPLPTPGSTTYPYGAPQPPPDPVAPVVGGGVPTLVPLLTNEQFSVDEEAMMNGIDTGYGSTTWPYGAPQPTVPPISTYHPDPRIAERFTGMVPRINPPIIQREPTPAHPVFNTMQGRGPIPTPNHPAFGVRDDPPRGPASYMTPAGIPAIPESSYYRNMYLPNYDVGGFVSKNPADIEYTNDDTVVIEAKVGEHITKAPNDTTANITQGNPNGGWDGSYDPENRKYQGPAGDMSGKTPNRPGGGGAGSTNTGQGSQDLPSFVANYFDQPDSFATQNPQSFQGSSGVQRQTAGDLAEIPYLSSMGSGISGGGSFFSGSQDIPYGSTGERLAQLQSQFYARAKSMGATDEQAAHWASQQSALFDMAERERRIAAQQRFVRLGPRRIRYA